MGKIMVQGLLILALIAMLAACAEFREGVRNMPTPNQILGQDPLSGN
jgi:hypothetical protein